MEYVVGFVFDPLLHRVLLIEKNRPEWQKGLMNGIGGKIEEYETPIEAMVRECEEESGLYTTDWTLKIIMHEGGGNVIYFFTTIHEDMKRAKALTDEKLFNIIVASLPKMNVIPNLKWLIPMSLDDCGRFPILLKYDRLSIGGNKN